VKTKKSQDLRGGGPKGEKTTENLGTKTNGNYPSNRRRGIQDTTPGSRTIYLLSGGGGQNFRNISTS
jgi:hypothetical protein